MHLFLVSFGKCVGRRQELILHFKSDVIVLYVLFFTKVNWKVTLSVLIRDFPRFDFRKTCLKRFSRVSGNVRNLGGECF